MAQVDQVDDAETEPAPLVETTADEVVQPAAPGPRRSGFIGLLMGGAASALLGFGLAQYVPRGWPSADTAAMQARLTAQDTAIEALRAELVAQAANPSDASIAPRLSKLEAEFATLPDGLPLENRIGALETRFSALESMPVDGSGVSVAAIAALRAEVESLKAAGSGDIAALTAKAEAQINQAEAQAAQLNADAEAMVSEARLRAALGRIQAALDSGAPFGAALKDLGAAVPSVLTETAETGLPTIGDLQQSFPEAARLALEAALRANMGEGWAERVGSFLRSQTGARSLAPREGSDPDAVLSRAEAALAAGDIQGAIAETDALPKVAQEKLAPWRILAELRLTAVAAVDALAVTLGE